MRLLMIATCAMLCDSAAHAQLVLVEEGRPRCVLVVDEGDPSGKSAAADLKYHLDRAAGCDVPLISIDALDAAPADAVRVFVGDSPAVRALGIVADSLELEQYRIVTFPAVRATAASAGRPASLVVVGRSRGSRPRDVVSPGTQYAVNHLLDRHLGVRWLWPGELGTYVPRASTIALPPLDVTGQPPLLTRNYSTPLLKRELASERADVQQARLEMAAWNDHHAIGKGRSLYRFGHAFMKWWDRYHESHPDYFALPPEGKPQKDASAVKLCVSNPEVAARIVDEWKEAGAPVSWNVCPNDGNGFCTCERCRALDQSGDNSPDDVWNGDADVNLRYVDLWNRVLRQMKQTRPDAKLCTYAYSSYRNIRPGVELEPGLLAQMVHTPLAFDQWEAWSEAGARLALRPNWWHSGAVAPYIPLHMYGRFFEFARQHGMVQFSFDSNHGYFATQGPNYYLIARMAERPDLSVDQVIDEWCSAFGKAAPSIRRYLDYWERYSDEVGMAVAAGGAVSIKPDGLYESVCREHDLAIHPLTGSWRVLPYLYTDEVLAPAMALLEEAAHAAGDGEDAAEVKQRIEFLREGLRHLVASRDLVALAYEIEELPRAEAKARLPELEQRAREFLALGRALTPRHVVSGEVVHYVMNRRNIAPFGRRSKLDLRGY